MMKFSVALSAFLAMAATGAVAAPSTSISAQATVTDNKLDGSAVTSQYSVGRNDGEVSGGYNYRTDVQYQGTPTRVETPMITGAGAGASAYTDLAQGKVGAYARAPSLASSPADTVSVYASAGTSLREALAFSVADATYRTRTTISYEITLHGVFSGTGNWGVNGGLGSSDGYGTQFYAGGSTMADGTLSSSKGVVSYTALSLTEGVLRGSSTFVGETWNPLFELFLNVQAYSDNADGPRSGLADMGNTATIKFLLPTNVTMTSASGQFLSGGGTPAVPEPATWLTTILGFGMVGAGLRARRGPQAARG